MSAGGGAVAVIAEAAARRPEWRRRDAAQCVWADCGDGVVLYHRPSGKSHLMNDASVALLTHVLVEPRSLEEITAAFDADLDLSRTDEFATRMQSLLLRLEHFGLVERT